jgi:hypothetical protein
MYIMCEYNSRTRELLVDVIHTYFILSSQVSNYVFMGIAGNS